MLFHIPTEVKSSEWRWVHDAASLKKNPKTQGVCLQQEWAGELLPSPSKYNASQNAKDILLGQQNKDQPELSWF